MSKILRTGKSKTVDATLSNHRKALVVELEDGTVEYFVGNSARNKNGYATLPESLVGKIVWDLT